MRLDKSIVRLLISAVILCGLTLQNCMDVPRDNAADKGCDNYNDIYADKTITAFSFDALNADGVINENESTIVVPVLYGSDVASIAAEFTTNAETVSIDGREQRSGITVNDFSVPVYYEVTARDGSKREYTVSIREVLITSFSLSDPALNFDDSVNGTIDYDNYTITVNIPYYMNKLNLIASFNAVGDLFVGGEPQESGTTENDFSDAVTYDVEDENGISQEYAVIVTDKEVTVAHFAGPLGGPGIVDGIGSAAAFRNPTDITSDLYNLYVTDTANYTIRKIEISTGNVTTLAGSPGVYGYADGTGTEATFYSIEGITTDGVNLYVCDSWYNTIRKIVISTGEVTTFAGYADHDNPGLINAIGTLARFNHPHDITTDGTNLYVADTSNNCIRKIEISTAVVSTLSTGYSTPYGIAIDSQRTYLYVTNFGNYSICRASISGGSPTTIAGGSSGYNDNSTGTSAGFGFPYDIAVDGNYLYVTDSSYHTIRQISLDSPYAVTTFAGTATVDLAHGCNDGMGNAALFYKPQGITINGRNLYIADSSNNTIRIISLDNRFVSTFAGAATEEGSTDGTGTAARFRGPRAITTDGINLYVCDIGKHTIRQITISGAIVTTIAGLAGTANFSDGIGTAALFNNPTGITYIGGSIYVVDRNNARIRKIVVSGGLGDVTTIAGNGTFSDDDNTTGTDATFNYPYGVTTDGTNLYIASGNNCTIRQISLTPPYAVTTLAGSGAWGFADGTGTEAKFWCPESITIVGTDLYVADTGNQAIRKVVISSGVGTVTTLAGAYYDDDINDDSIVDVIYSNDGIGTEARFCRPMGITTDGTNLYVADRYNHSIRKITISTREVTTIAGTPEISGVRDGIGSISSFYSPVGIMFYNKKLYVADMENNAIRVINP